MKELRQEYPELEEEAIENIRDAIYEYLTAINDLVLDEKDRALSLVNEFVQIKFKRHHALRSEVKRVVAGSALLKDLRAV